MTELRTRREIKTGWWIETRATVLAILPRDGQLVVFRREDVETLMDKEYPHKQEGFRKVWYFNETRDREIAETDPEDRICANPQVLLQYYMRP